MTKVRVYWDLDGTLAKWRTSATDDELKEEYYFLSLDPEDQLCSVANELAKNKNVETHILTSYLTDSKYAKKEKLAWVDTHVSNIGKNKVLCVPYGVTKSSFIERLAKRRLSKNDILIDDHSPNLIAWKCAGGTAIKWCNGINNSGKSSFDGIRLNKATRISDFINGMLAMFA